MTYYVITQSDGEVQVEEVSKAALEAHLSKVDDPVFVSNPGLAGVVTPADWSEGAMLIIRGEVVVPQAKEKVVVWEV